MARKQRYNNDNPMGNWNVVKMRKHMNVEESSFSLVAGIQFVAAAVKDSHATASVSANSLLRWNGFASTRLLPEQCLNSSAVDYNTHWNRPLNSNDGLDQPV